MKGPQVPPEAEEIGVNVALGLCVLLVLFLVLTAMSAG